jgi:sigma-B regulation protein RsbU (phosphoserine phosphatase)
MLVIVLILGALVVGLTFHSSGTYRQLERDRVQSQVDAQVAELNSTITSLSKRAHTLALMGEQLDQAGTTAEFAVAATIDNISDEAASVGGGIWYAPDHTARPSGRECYYALRTGPDQVVNDPTFESADYNYPTQSWYVEITTALAENPAAVVWTAPYQDETGSEAWMTTVGAGMYDRDGALIGISTVDWSLSEVAVDVDKIKPTATSFALLASLDTNIVLAYTATGDSFVGRSLGALPWITQAVADGQGEWQDRTYLAFSRTVSDRMLVASLVPEDELFAQINQTIAWTVVIMTAGALAVLIIVFVVVRYYIGRVEKMTTERVRIVGELSAATEIQSSLLPSIFPAFPNRTEFDLYAVTRPAKEVGGDFYDFFMCDDDHLALVVADVSGKGVPAALFMVIAKTLIKNHLQTAYEAGVEPGQEPAATLTKVNRQLSENNTTSMFVTAFVTVVNIRTGAVFYANAGHNPPLILHRQPDAGRLDQFTYLRTEPQLMLAAFEDTRYTSLAGQFHAGEAVVMYTDGVTEATDATNHLFGEDRLLASLNQRADQTMADLTGGLQADVAAFVGQTEQFDDITVLAYRWNGVPATDAGTDDGEAAAIPAVVASVTASAEVPRSGAKETTTGPADDDATLLASQTWPADLDHVAAAMDFVEQTLTEAAADQAQVMKILLAVDEICANIVHYAGSAELTIECRHLAGPPRWAVTFIDQGQPYNPLERADPDISLSPEERPIGGLGIFVVKQTMDEVWYRHVDGANQLTVAVAAAND